MENPVDLPAVMKTALKEEDKMWHLVSKAGSDARSPPAEQSLPLSIEETGSPVVQEHESVEESGSHEIFSLPALHVLSEYFCDIHEGNFPLKLKMDKPPGSVPSKIKDDVDPQESTTPGLEQEPGTPKTLSHEAEAKQGVPEEVPTGETHLFLTEKMNEPLTGITDPCEIQSPLVPSGNCTEKKKKRRRRRRKLVEKAEDQFLYKSFVELLSMVVTVLQISLKMASGLKAFGATHLRELVSGGFLNRFRSSALRGTVVEWRAILILLFLPIFHSASGLKTCEQMFNSTTVLECPITLLNLKDSSQSHVCNLKELACCPERTKCSKTLSLCLWNNYSSTFFYSEEDCGRYALEYGTKTDDQKIVHLVSQNCKESPTNRAQTSGKDPQRVTAETDPTKRPGDETSTVDKGIAAGVPIAVLVLLALGAVTYLCCRRRQKKMKSKKNCLTSASSHSSEGTSIDSVI